MDFKNEKTPTIYLYIRGFAHNILYNGLLLQQCYTCSLLEFLKQGPTIQSAIKDYIKKM